MNTAPFEHTDWKNKTVNLLNAATALTKEGKTTHESCDVQILMTRHVGVFIQTKRFRKAAGGLNLMNDVTTTLLDPKTLPFPFDKIHTVGWLNISVINGPLKKQIITNINGVRCNMQAGHTEKNPLTKTINNLENTIAEIQAVLNESVCEHTNKHKTISDKQKMMTTSPTLWARLPSNTTDITHPNVWARTAHEAKALWAIIELQKHTQHPKTMAGLKRTLELIKDHKKKHSDPINTHHSLEQHLQSMVST